MSDTIFNIKDYPFTKCLNPRKIINPYSHQTLVVPCGKCRACALNKDSRNSFLCSLESLSHKYCMFVTLTFANRFIPRAIIYSSYELEDVDLPVRHYLVDKETIVSSPLAFVALNCPPATSSVSPITYDVLGFVIHSRLCTGFDTFT